MRKIANMLMLLSIVAINFTSCKKDDEIPAIPVLPPESSFSMDFSAYDGSEKSANMIVKNWLYSKVNVVFFSTISASTMVIPAAAFNASLALSPTYIGDQTWQWTYDVPVIGSTYSVKLNGITEKKGNVKWEMYVSKAGLNPFSDFLWVEGTVKDSTSASWTVNEDPYDPTPSIQTEWKSSKDHQTFSLKYTIINPASDSYNSYIVSKKDPSKDLDRSYEIYRSNEKEDILIEWSSTYLRGKVKSPTYFGDTEYHCWNDYLLDAWCE